MKKVLITGANSYIGTSFEKYLKEHFSDEYLVDTVDMIDGSWREKSFSGYDTVFHVAGIAHIKETAENKDLFFKVNRDLAIEAAQKAKNEGVDQFIFLSTLSVYGMVTGTITADTVPDPKTSYGMAKYEAEQHISAFSDPGFRICIIRPPMVYGKGCKGNFQKIVKIVKKSPVFPKVNNKRSMIYIENLCACVELIIRSGESRVYIPQDPEYMNTSLMARWIADSLNKKLFLSRLLGWLVVCACPFSSTIQKAFGDLIVVTDQRMDFCEEKNEASVKKCV